MHRRILSLFFSLLALAVARAQETDYRFSASAEASTWFSAAVTDVPALSALYPEGIESYEIGAGLDLEAEHRLALGGGLKGFLRHRLLVSPDGNVEHKIYRAFIQWQPADTLNLFLGKQRLRLSLGYVWSPLDVLNGSNGKGGISLTGTDSPLDPQNALAQAEGFDGILFSWSPAVFATLALGLSADNAFSPAGDRPWEKLRGAFSLSLAARPFEILFACVYQYEETLRPGLAFSLDLEGFLIHAQVAVELHSRLDEPVASTVSPLGFDFAPRSLWKPLMLASGGVMRRFSGDGFSVTLLAEYMYSEESYKQEALSLLYRGLETLTALGMPMPLDDVRFPPLLGRHHLYGSVGLEIDRVLSFENSLLLNPLDGSGLVWHTLTFFPLDALDLSLAVNWVFGRKAQTEFGLIPRTMMVSLGAKLYF